MTDRTSIAATPSPAALKIVFCVNAAWNIWNFRRALVQALIADGHEVIVLAPEDATTPKLIALGCRFVPLRMNAKGLNPITDLRLMLRLRRAFRGLAPDVVLGFTIKNNIFGALAAKSIGLPFMPNVTGLGTAFLSGGFLRRVAITLYKRAFRTLPVVFFQNADDRALFLRSRIITPDQAVLLPGSGIDLAAFPATDYPPPDQPITFLMIARVLRDKGALEYVDAARKIKAAVPSVRFQLLGPIDTQNRSAIDRSTVQQWQDDGVIDYLGAVEDVRPFIAAAHCVVLPSYREGAPRTLIEAAAMARPVIATDVPGCRDVVSQGITGFLCAVQSADSLAAALSRFLALDRGAQEQLGQAGRAKMVLDYDQRIVVEAYQKAIAPLAMTRG